MDYRNLIEKFFSGETSREEEVLLCRYLMGDDLPDDILKEREMLLAMLQPAEYDCGEEMDGISAMIDELACKEAAQAEQKPALRRVLLRYVGPALAVAAVLALLFMVVPYAEDGVQQAAAPVAVVTDIELPSATVSSDEVPAVGENDEIVLPKDEEPVQDVAVEMVAGRETEPETKLLAETAEIVVVELSEPPMYISSSSEQEETCYMSDTFSNPEDAAKHVEVLFAIFSDVAARGMGEQKTHLGQFAVLNKTNDE